MDLVTLDEVIAHLRLPPEPDDQYDIELKISAASAAIVRYLGDSVYVDSEGNVFEDVKIAALFLVGYLYRLRDEDESREFFSGYLPAPVITFLYPLRVPPLG